MGPHVISTTSKLSQGFRYHRKIMKIFRSFPLPLLLVSQQPYQQSVFGHSDLQQRISAMRIAEARPATTTVSASKISVPISLAGFCANEQIGGW